MPDMLGKASGVAIMMMVLNYAASMAWEEMPAEACDRLAALEADPIIPRRLSPLPRLIRRR